ncbi:MAG: hypothetical protein E7578_03500 [Ruminococcaceae bacterium]|nr:hypothetical protein [Oscillospiraceae bacterium]
MERFKKWFENYWYHNKWPTLIVLLFVVVFAIGFGQIIGEKTNYDVYTLYAGATYLPKEAHDGVKTTLSEISVKAAGDEGQKEKDVNLQMLIYLTEADVEEQKKAAEAAGQDYTFNYIENRNVYDTFMKQLVSGENVIMFLSPYLYETAEKNEALYSMKDILGRTVPGLTSSGCGVRLSESGLIEKYPGLKNLPEDTIVCLRRVTHAMKLIGKSESNESHMFQLDVAREMFKGIG